MINAIQTLQEELSKLPQVEIPTEHLFADGMYMRSVSLRKGTVVVGKVHKTEHFAMLIKGVMRIASNNERTIVLEAPKAFVSRPGVKRAVIALEDSIFVTIHRLCDPGERDLAVIEDEIGEPDPTSMFLPGNVLKPKALK